MRKTTQLLEGKDEKGAGRGNFNESGRKHAEQDSDTRKH